VKFDAVCGEVINIIVSYDMGWSKRGNGRSYDSLNGYAAIIGFASKKVLDYTTRNRKCSLCDRNHDPTSHDCRKNFEGSAKAMEADAGVELVTRSKVLQDAKLNVGVLIGDEDSSTIANINKASNKLVHKLADKNHLVKNFVNDLYKLSDKFKQLKRKGVIQHLKKCFCYAIAQNKGKTTELAAVIKSIPDHVYNHHENCGTWCNRIVDNSKQTVTLSDDNLFNELKKVFVNYANNAFKFIVAASSQANESLNSIIVSRASKARCYSKSESCDFRVSSGVLSKNEGDVAIYKIKKDYGVLQTKHSLHYFAKMDRLKKIKTANKITKTAKLRRIQLAKIRENLRKKKRKKRRSYVLKQLRNEYQRITVY